MSKGGKREGAGRKPGSLTKRTREVAERAAAEGKTPLEVLLENMRHFQKVAHDAEAVIEAMTEDQVVSLGESHEERFKGLLAKVKAAAGLRQLANEVAKDAAPFMHARLASIEFSGEITTTKVIRTPAITPDADAWRKDSLVRFEVEEREWVERMKAAQKPN